MVNERARPSAGRARSWQVAVRRAACGAVMVPPARASGLADRAPRAARLHRPPCLVRLRLSRYLPLHVEAPLSHRRRIARQGPRRDRRGNACRRAARHHGDRPRPRPPDAGLRSRCPHEDRAGPGRVAGRDPGRRDARLADRDADPQPRLGQLAGRDGRRGDAGRGAPAPGGASPTGTRRPGRRPQVRPPRRPRHPRACLGPRDHGPGGVRGRRTAAARRARYRGRVARGVAGRDSCPPRSRATREGRGLLAVRRPDAWGARSGVASRTRRRSAGRG